MYKKFTRIYLVPFFLLLCYIANAQRPDSILNTLEEKYPQEKIYIQYDRPYYNPGETIWFKAYLFAGSTATGFSKTIYAELITDKGKLLQKKIMPVIESGAGSFFDLPDTLTSTTVYIRAYTAWMLNFDASLLYTKGLSIVSNAKKSTTAPAYFLQFFPEGGDLVYGVESLVAFKATDQSGVPYTVNGTIENKSGKKVVEFSTTHDGMGTFAFTPANGEAYTAKWRDKKGIAHETALPQPKKQGLVLSVIKTGNQALYNLKRPDSAEAAFTSFWVIAQIQQQLIYSAKINMSAKKEITAAIPLDSIGNGVVQLTVFNGNNIPVAERIFFVNHNNYYFNTDLHAIELNLTKRKHNTLQIDVGGNIVTNLSISVTDESLSAPTSNIDHIYSNVLLTSDLKGTVYNPAYYFSSEEDSVAQQLDLVMLTNGWRRFKWEDLLAGKFPTIKYQPDNYITINGIVYGPTSSMLNGKEVTGILKTKSGDDIFTMPVTSDGKFAVTGAVFFDSARLYYQFNQDQGKTLTSSSTFNFKVNFANAEPPALSSINNITIPLLPDTAVVTKNKKIAKAIKEEFKEGIAVKSLDVVTLKSKVKTKEQKLDETFTSGFFTGGDAYSFVVEDDVSAATAPSVLSYLQAKVAGLLISTNPSPSATWRGSQTSFYLNESTSDISTIQGISMRDVAYIKVFRPPFFSSTGGGAGGAIAIYLKRGVESKDFKALEFVKLNGYSTIREFYSPDYEKLGDNAPANDYRTTLYWNASLLMDKTNRRIKIPFYNNDSCKKIRVIIEGINKEGLLTREEKVFE